MTESKWTTGRPLWYLLDEQGVPYPSSDISATEALLGDVDKRRVALTEKLVAGHTLYLSTVFLVMDHDYFTGIPVLYETMLFIDEEPVSSATERYHTREEAAKGHKRIEEGVEQVLMQFGERNLDTAQVVGLLGDITP